MKQHMLVFGLFMMFVALGSIRFIEDNDYIYTRGDIVLHANVDNQDSKYEVKNARVKFLILDGGIIGASHTSDIGAGDIGVKTAYSDSYNLAPNEYLVRIYVYGDDGERRIKHRYINIR